MPRACLHGAGEQFARRQRRCGIVARVLRDERQMHGAALEHAQLQQVGDDRRRRASLACAITCVEFAGNLNQPPLILHDVDQKVFGRVVAGFHFVLACAAPADELHGRRFVRLILRDQHDAPIGLSRRIVVEVQKARGHFAPEIGA